MSGPKDGSGQEVVHPAVAMAADAIMREENAKRCGVVSKRAGYGDTDFTCLGDKDHETEHGPWRIVPKLTLPPDNVNHPSHYTDSPAKCSKCGHPIECIDVVEYSGFNIGNAQKYLWRQGRKLGVDPREDIRKAIWYLNREVAKLTRELK